MNFLATKKTMNVPEVYIKKKEKKKKWIYQKTKVTPHLGQQDLVSSTGTFWYIYTTRDLTKRRKKKQREAMICDDILL